MSDTLALSINNSRIEHFQTYSVDSDLYTADHAFSFKLANPEIEVKPGQQCKLFINKALELTGIIESRHRHCDKQGRSLTVAGRDLMGIVIDSYCEEFVTVKGMTIKELAEFLIRGNPKTGRPPLPFISRLPITGDYLTDVGEIKSRKRRGTADFLSFFDSPQKLAQIAPGMTVFQVLQQYALSRGAMFFSLPDGTFVFDEPVCGGEPDYFITFTKDGNCNALSADVEENISKRWSKVTVIGQQQNNDPSGSDTGTVQTKGIATDPDFPFYKPFVQVNNNDSQSPKLRARLLLNKMRHDGFKLEYEMPRHSQNNKVYTINRIVNVRDDVHGIYGNFLVTGRTLRLEEPKPGGQKGPTTLLRLGLPGLVEAEGKLGGHGK